MFAPRGLRLFRQDLVAWRAVVYRDFWGKRYPTNKCFAYDVARRDRGAHYDSMNDRHNHENRMIRETKALSEQETLLPFLLNPNSYPHHPRSVRIIQTHSSFVFIAGPLTFKIKKPVSFGFLDFSTLDKRRHFCEREVFLNRRLSPGMYLGVQPISRLDGTFAFSDAGEIIEYAVKMRTLSDAGFLDRRVDRGALGAKDLNRAIQTLTQFYGAQIPAPTIQEWGRVARLKISTDENFRQTEAFIGKTISKAAFGAIQRYTNRFYSTHKRLFEQRVAQQRIRDCHGDLHLEHIHVTPRALHIYDCIEFNDRFRYIDVANDVAFLAMDLDYKCRPDLAQYFVMETSKKLRDPGMVKLVDFYKCYRAFVRGKVESLHSVAHAAPEGERKSSVARAARYFRLALQYCISGSKPMVLIVMGRIASGKTTLACKLSMELGWDHLSSDWIRKEMAGFPLFERTPEAVRVGLYSKRATKRTYKKMLQAAVEQIRLGRSVIVDATFARPEHRAQFKRRLARAGIHFLFAETSASNRTIQQRLRDRDRGQIEISDARLEDFEKLAGLYNPPTELGRTELIRIKGKVPPLMRVLSMLAERQARQGANRL